ncbi:hypothetical protein ACWEOH_02430 [Agromyces sp. NPDC004153]
MGTHNTGKSGKGGKPAPTHRVDGKFIAGVKALTAFVKAAAVFVGALSTLAVVTLALLKMLL